MRVLRVVIVSFLNLGLFYGFVIKIVDRFGRDFFIFLVLINVKYKLRVI